MSKKIKCAPVDFTQAMLPKNRKQVFFDCLKLRYSVFLWAGLILLLFSLPIIITLLFRDNQIYGLYSAYLEGAISQAELDAALVNYRMSLSLPMIIAIPVFGVGLGGVIHVLRNLVWGEGIYYSADFKRGVKNNLSRMLFVFITGAAILLLCLFIETYMSDVGNPVRYILFGLVYVILFPPALWMISLSCVYNFKWTSFVKNGFILYVKTFPVTILFAAIIVGVYFGLLVIPIVYVKYILLFVIIVFLLPIYIVLWLLYSNYIFDKFINKEAHPEFVDKGVGGRLK